MSLQKMFRSHGTLRAVIEAVIERQLGDVDANHPATPQVACLRLGCYAIFGGNALHPDADALVRTVTPPRELLIPDDQAWRDLLHQTHGRRLSDRPMRTFSAAGLSTTRLLEMAGRIPEGFSIEAIDADMAGQLDAGLVPHAMQVFPDVATFLERGVGFAALRKGRVCSAATSYTMSSRRVEAAIATREKFRGRGLARVVAAHMLLHCLEHGRVPEWSASNPVSKRLALDLGYRPGPLCDVFYLE